MLLFIFPMLLISHKISAEEGINCNTPDARCSAYELDVDAEVIQAVIFEQVRPLNFGQITAGEHVDVQFSNNGRGKRPGLLRITVGTGDYEVRILPESSIINVDTENGMTSQGVQDAYISEEGEEVDLPWMNGKGLGPRTFNLLIRSSINIPSNAKSGLITGSMRIEVVYL